MKPQELTLESDVFNGLRINMNEAIRIVMKSLISKKLYHGSVTAKIDIMLTEETDENTGECCLMPAFFPEVSFEIKNKDKIKCNPETGMYLKKGPMGQLIIGTNQITMDELIAEQEGA
jgi:hypothetical protein